jgi:predicted glycoside hydrolase/deacetylase ChbG (UPF0249 family)
VNGSRSLVVNADDFGIGPDTSRGILDLGREGLVTSTVMLVNSPHAEPAVRAWRQNAQKPELGWHPCLTLDRPVLSAGMVPSLVGSDGCFHRLGSFLRRLCLRQIRPAEIVAEYQAQYARFIDLVGRPPLVVNTHHHVQVFPVVSKALAKVLEGRRPAPYVRRVREPWRVLAWVPGARIKRLVLTSLGRLDARRHAAQGLPGNDWLAGVTDPPCVGDPFFLTRWLARMPGRVVELTCHPGYRDDTLLGRDATEGGWQMERRVSEMERLRDPRFLEAVARAGFQLVAPSDLAGKQSRAA